MLTMSRFVQGFSKGQRAYSPPFCGGKWEWVSGWVWFGVLQQFGRGPDTFGGHLPPTLAPTHDPRGVGSTPPPGAQEEAIFPVGFVS